MDRGSVRDLARDETREEDSERLRCGSPLSVGRLSTMEIGRANARRPRWLTGADSRTLDLGWVGLGVRQL
jgi:hypothetical protein